MVAIRDIRLFEAQVGPSPEAANNQLIGTLRRSYDLDGTNGAACVLVTDDGQAFQLNTFEGSEVDWSNLTDRSLRYLTQFEAQMVRVSFAQKEDSVFGPSLWGVKVEALSS